MSKTCLVTGGAGFIGCAISKGLAEAFDRVVAVDNLHPQIHATRVRPLRLDPRVELVEGDVTHPAVWDQLLDAVRPTVVVHLAAETGTGQSLTEGSRHANVNVVGTTQMLDAFVRADALPERIVLTSSRATYGEGAWRSKSDGSITYPGQRSREMLERGIWDFPGLECLPFEAATVDVRPTSIYGSTKLAQEHILTSWAKSFAVDTAILRLQNVYGPGQSLTNPYTGIVSLFVRLAREGRVIPVYEDGQIVRDFVFIQDVADAILRITVGGSPTSAPYDIGSGEATTILQLAQMIASHYRAPHPEVNGLFRNGDVRHASCSITRATTDLGWTPVWSVEGGVNALCDWIDSVLG